MHLIHLLGLCVIRLHVLIPDRPSRRDSVVFTKLPEILLAQTVQGSSVHFGGAPDKVVNLRLEWFPIGVVPGIRGDVSIVDEDSLRIPVQSLTFQPVAAFENQDALAGGCEVASQGTSAGSTPDDDDVVIAWHGCAPLQARAALHEPAVGENRCCSDVAGATIG